jgi:inner membrane protein
MTSPTHAVMVLALGAATMRRRYGGPVVAVGAVCAVIPDLDLLAPIFGGTRAFHRTLTHGIPFAGLLAVVAAGAGWRYRRRASDGLSIGIWIGLATISHAILDMLTTYPMGVALLSPLAAARYVLPWQPIESVSQEFVWVFLPSVTLLLLAWRRRVSS